MKIEIKKWKNKLILIYDKKYGALVVYTFDKSKGKELKQFEGLEMNEEIKKWCSANDIYAKGLK